MEGRSVESLTQAKGRTFGTPVLVGLAEHHHKLLSGEGAQVRDREDGREASFEHLDGWTCSATHDGINGQVNVFFHIVRGDIDIFAGRLIKSQER
jgi:hypothetical protein